MQAEEIRDPAAAVTQLLCLKPEGSLMIKPATIAILKRRKLRPADC